ncbi:MAG: hypothetical protein IT381_25575 [Deltaproteobacteria bacterium]|nr:hypothetical protein [Deltaproteobacteria bacterium]
MNRSNAHLALLLACFVAGAGCRSLPKVTAKISPIEPAFLGERSGIYRIVESVGPLRVDAGVIAVLEVDNYVLAFLATRGDDFRMSLVSKDGNAADARFAGKINNRPVDVAISGVPILLRDGTLRFDVTPQVVTVLGGPSAPPALASGCADGACYFGLQKECDYDSVYSGVFEVLESCDPGSTASSGRQWVVSTSTGGDALVIALDDAGAPEFGATFDFNRSTLQMVQPVSQRLAKVATFSSLRLQNEKTDVRLAATITIDGETTNVCAVRRRGAREGGVSCASRSAFSCATDLSTCPALPKGTVASYRLLELAEEPVLSQQVCPRVERCETMFSANELCDPASRRIAWEGCRKGSVVVTNGDDCLRLSCDESIPCDDERLAGPGSCGAGNDVSLHRQDGCVRVRCAAKDPGCEPLFDCTTFALGSYVATDSESLCPRRFCSYGIGVLDGLKTAVSAPYRIVDLTAEGLPIVQPAGGAQDACAPIDLSLKQLSCPTSGSLGPHHACAQGGSNRNVAPAIYAGRSGPCLTLLADGRQLFIPQCSASQEVCCEEGASAPPRLACRSKSSVKISLQLEAGLTPVFVHVAETTTRDNEVFISRTPPSGGSGFMPMRFVDGETVTLQMTSSATCVFSAVSTGATGVTGNQSITLAIAEGAPSTITVDISCP